MILYASPVLHHVSKHHSHVSLHLSYINGERYRHIGGRTKDEFIRTVKLARRGLADDDTDDEALSLEPPDQGSASAEYEEIIV